jgi:hypothetical protein
MKTKFLYLLFILLCIIQCTKNPEKPPFHKVVFDPLLKDSFFLMDKWSYPSFAVKIGEGKFDFTDGVEDTSHQHHTADIVYVTDSLNDNENYWKALKERIGWSHIRYGKAYLVGETIILNFDEFNASASDNLTIKIKGGYFSTLYYGGTPVAGNKYYDFEEESIIIQKQALLVGDTLKGYLDFKAYKPQYLHLKGAFKVCVLKNGYY